MCRPEAADIRAAASASVIASGPVTSCVSPSWPPSASSAAHTPATSSRVTNAVRPSSAGPSMAPAPVTICGRKSR